MNSPTRSLLGARWRQACAVLIAGSSLAALLVACGGGGSNPPAAGGGPTIQSVARGPINGLGSIIVNGVRFDDSSAQVENDEDGSAGHSARELKLGMMVEVQAGAIDNNAATATAAVVRFGSEMVGLVASTDKATQTLRVLDQTIDVKPTTVFEDGLAGFDAIVKDQVLEIHAQFDATTGHYVATRIETEAGATAFRLRGVISALNNTSPKTFKIGDAVINFDSVPAADLPIIPLADGQTVRVRLQTVQVAGQWVATSVRNGVRKVEDSGDARLRGMVTAFTSPQKFAVQGIPVDAANATFEPDAKSVVLGALVEVRGQASNGTIVATRVKVRNQNDDDLKQVELHGTVSALDTSKTTFMLREVKIDYSQVKTWKDGQPTDLVNDKKVEVKGVWSADHSVLIAAVIDFET